MHWIIVLALLLAACSAEPDKPRRTAQDRQAAAEAALSRTPVPRSYRFDGNELKIIDVPVRDASNFVDLQRCFVWRDAEFKTATLSCGQQPDEMLGPN